MTSTFLSVFLLAIPLLAQRTPEMEKVVLKEISSVCDGQSPYYCKCRLDHSKQPPYTSGRDITDCFVSYCVCTDFSVVHMEQR